MTARRGEAVRPAGAPMVPMPHLRAAPEESHHPVGAAREAATDLVSTARARGGAEVDRRASQVAQRMAMAAGDMRDIAGELRGKHRDEPARLAEEAADRVERFADYLQRSDSATIIADARRLTRRQPALVVAGAAVIGLAAGRVVRASADSDGEAR